MSFTNTISRIPKRTLLPLYENQWVDVNVGGKWHVAQIKQLSGPLSSWCIGHVLIQYSDKIASEPTHIWIMAVPFSSAFVGYFFHCVDLLHNHTYRVQPDHPTICYSVGDTVECLSTSLKWTSAYVATIDYNHGQLLVCYDHGMLIVAEWINAECGRLRPNISTCSTRCNNDMCSIEQGVFLSRLALLLCRWLVCAAALSARALMSAFLNAFHLITCLITLLCEKAFWTFCSTWLFVFFLYRDMHTQRLSTIIGLLASISDPPEMNLGFHFESSLSNRYSAVQRIFLYHNCSNSKQALTYY